MHITLIADEAIAADLAGAVPSRFHTFPSLTHLRDGTRWCSFLEGSEKTGPDGRIRCFRSAREGGTWEPAPSPADADARDPRHSYLMCHALETEPGHLLAVYQRVDRSDPSAPLFHPRTSGMRPATVRLSRSTDGGKCWSAARDLEHRIADIFVPGKPLILPDGTLGLPGEVWHEWDRGFVESPASLLVLSHDAGETWPSAAVMAKSPDGAAIHGDPRIASFADGRLVCLFWKYSLATGKDEPVHVSFSEDGGRSWSTPASTGLVSQIASPLCLGGDVVLCVYQRRFGESAGIRAVLSRDGCRSFDEDTDILLWKSPTGIASNDPFAGYAHYAFGYSSIVRKSDREAYVIFWAGSGSATGIHLLTVAAG
jgi:hypothetical protein